MRVREIAREFKRENESDSHRERVGEREKELDRERVGEREREGERVRERERVGERERRREFERESERAIRVQDTRFRRQASGYELQETSPTSPRRGIKSPFLIAVV